MAEPLDRESFHVLLRWLANDPEAAAVKYLELQRRLTAVFEYRRCPHPDELTDETLQRVGRRLKELGSEFKGPDPIRYAFGVAWNVARESFRRPAGVSLPDGWENRRATAPSAVGTELDESCLEACLARLGSDDRQLVLDYHRGEGSDRIRERSDLANARDLSPNALRLRIHRLTARLRECVVRCVEQDGLTSADAVS